MNEILVIGAGPAGLAMGGRLRKKGLNFDLVEKAENIASSWRSHYDRLRLHTVKKFSNLPHLPFPDNYPKFVSKDQLITYLENYTERFNLNPQLGVEVNNIKRNGQKWSVTTNKGENSYQKVIIATGVNRVPMSPTFKNESAFKGEIIHSKSYKNPAPFLNKKVLIVGMGNTGAEIALDLCNSNVQTDISIRSKINIVPLELFGRATQETAFTLNKLPRPIANTLSKLVQKIAVGDLSKYGIEKPDMSPIDQLSKTGKTPVIDLGTVAAIKSGKNYDPKRYRLIYIYWCKVRGWQGSGL